MKELPRGWAATTLGEISSKPQYGWTSKASYRGHIKYIRTTDISGRKLNWETVPFCELEPTDLEKFRVRKDDILVSRAGSVGVSFRIQEVPHDAVFASYLIRFNPLECVLARFVEYFLRSAEYWNSISEFSAGIAIPNVNASKLGEITIPLPPLDEQHRIVAKLKKLLSHVDAAQERLATIPPILKRFRQSVLAAACSGRLTADWRNNNPDTDPGDALLLRVSKKRTEWIQKQIKANNPEAKRLKIKLDRHSFESTGNNNLPETWTWSSLLHACWLVVDCHNKTAPYSREGIPLIRTTNIKSGRLVFNNLKFVSNETYKYWSRRCPPQANDILFTREAPMGESAIVPAGLQLCMGQRLMLFRVFEDLVDVKYFSYALQEPLFVGRLDENSIGSGVKHLRVGDVESLIVPMPPLAEQQEIVRRVDALFKIADALEARYLKAKAHVDKLTQSILAKAFGGELVPQDPNDEPASVLLERVRQQRNGTSDTTTRSTTKRSRR